MPDIDLFTLYSWLLGFVVTVYCLLVTGQSFWGWYVWLSNNDRYTAMLRRYILVQVVRLRFRTFWGELLICLLLCVAFCLMFFAQLKIRQIGDIYSSAHDNPSVKTR